jgi:serine/threonine protein kinase
MGSNRVNWEQLQAKILSYEPTVYPFEACTFGNQVGAGAAMIVYEGKSSAFLVRLFFFPSIEPNLPLAPTGTCEIDGVRTKVAFKEYQHLNNSKIRQKDADQVLSHFYHEIKLTKRLKHHPNIIQILGVTFKFMKPVLLVELANDPLDYYLDDRHYHGKTASWFEKVTLCLDVLRGVQGLHSASIVHGDLKGENILVFIGASGIPKAKLSDFGYSSTLTSMQSTSFYPWLFLKVVRLVKFNKRPSDTSTVGGTANFLAPESMPHHPELSEWQKKPNVDVYGLGLIVFQIAANGAKPYDYDGREAIFNAKAADFAMTSLLTGLPSDTPSGFQSVIIETTRFMPPDRKPLDYVERMLLDILCLPQVYNTHSSVPPVSGAHRYVHITLSSASRTI